MPYGAESSALPDRLQDVALVMSKVQACSWSPFKLNEIVTLEKCLQEASSEDPRIRLLLRKLAHECVFIEPKRKLSHLTRNESERHADLDLKRKTKSIKEETNRLGEQIDYYDRKLNDLAKHETDTDLQITQLRKSISLAESNYENSQKKFELVLERAQKSFAVSLHTIRVQLPDYMLSIANSQLVKQIKDLPISHGRCLMELTKIEELNEDEEQLATKFNFCMKKAMISRLKGYLSASSSFHHDLSLIHTAYSTEIPEEIEYLRALNTHIEFLESPLKEAPKKITIIYHDLNPVDQPQLSSGPPEAFEDQNFSQMFSSLSKKLKSSVVDPTSKQIC